MKILFITMVAAFAVSVQASNCSSNSVSVKSDSQDKNSLFSANELRVDVFGSYRTKGNNEWGGGVGIKYFLTENVGITGWTVVEDTGGVTFDNGYAALLLRLPITSSLAPYGLAGAGYNWTFEQVSAVVGGGVELRLKEHVGVFADYVYEFPEFTGEFGRARFGMSFGF